MRVDLHTHTTCSDGRLSPGDLVQKALQVGLDGLAITDHDSVEAWEEASAAAGDDIELIPGVELTTSMNGSTLHLLGYFFSPGHAGLAEFLAEDRNRRRRRAEAIVARLQSIGCPITFEDVLEQAGGATICRPHVARALHERGVVNSYQEAFVRYIGDDGPAYVNVPGASPEDAIRTVHEAGGVTSIAHPGRDVTPSMLDDLVDAGLDGIEVIHPSHDTLLTKQYRETANDRGLITTGGSDYHGYRDVEDQRFGYYTLNARQMEGIRAEIAAVTRS